MVSKRRIAIIQLVFGILFFLSTVLAFFIFDDYYYHNLANSRDHIYSSLQELSEELNETDKEMEMRIISGLFSYIEITRSTMLLFFALCVIAMFLSVILILVSLFVY